MALAETTTLRVPSELRDEIASLARERGTTMLEVVSEAVRRLRRDDWWQSVHNALDRLETADVAAYRSEAARLEAGAATDLRGY